MNNLFSIRTAGPVKVCKVLFLAGVLVITALSQPAAQETETRQNQDTQDIDESKLLLNGEEGEPAETGAAGEGEGEGDSEEPARLNSFTVWDFVRMIIILGAVIGLIYVVFYFIKKKGSPSLQNNELFSVISTQAVASNRAIHLVQVGNQYFLVGSGEQSVNLISEIEDKETVDEIRLKMSKQSPGQKKSFKDMLGGMFGQAGNVRLDGGSPVKSDFLKNQRDRLKRM